MSDPANKAAYSSTNLAALLAASAPIYMEDESAFNGSVLNPTQTTMTATIKGNSQKLTEVCTVLIAISFKAEIMFSF